MRYVLPAPIVHAQQPNPIYLPHMISHKPNHPHLIAHTQVVCVHTKNKIIHTEIEQFILCGTNITLNLVSSPSTLPT